MRLTYVGKRMRTEELKALFDQMTLEEKMGQLTQTTAEHFVQGEEDEMVETGPAFDELKGQREVLYTVGSVLGVSSARAINRIQRNFLSENRLQIPLLFMHDAIHGYRTIFPIPLALSSSFDEELIKKVARCTATELRASGIHVDFSPMTDLVRDARWGRVMESFGEDPMLSGNLGRAMIEGYQNSSDGTIGTDGVAACLKHFAAYGAADAGKDYASTDMSWKEFFGCYAKPYEISLKSKPRFVMSSFNSLNGEPVTASRYLLKDVLRDKFGFDGIVISDWGAISELKNHGVAADDKEAGRKALHAGVDIEMTSSSYLRFGKELVEGNAELEEKVDKAVWKVLCLKNELGLFEHPYVDEAAEENVLVSETMLEAAEEAALKSCVLLKNNGVLPMRDTYKNIIITGPYADTRELLGNWQCRGEFEETISLAEGMKLVYPDAEISVYENPDDCPEEILDKTDFILTAVGERWEMTGEGSSSANIELEEEQQKLLEKVQKTGKKSACVIFSGRPLAMQNIEKYTEAILWCWYPGNRAGIAAAKLLRGIVNPSGRLTMSLPRVSGQAPLYYNEYRSGRPANESTYSSRYQDCEIGAQYPFGHGLGYADIRFGELTCSSRTITEDESVSVSVEVWNNSEYTTEETVLLFMDDPVSELVRPVWELLNYKRLTLKPQEKTTVTFFVAADDLKYINNQLERVIEPGEIHLYLNQNTVPDVTLRYE